MQKPEPGMPASVVLADGKPRALRFSLRVLKELKTNEPSIDLLRGSGISAALNDPSALSLVLTAGLRAADPSITGDFVEENVDATMLMSIAPMLIYAATGQWIDVEAAAANATKNVSPDAANGRILSTGSKSGASGATISDSPTPTSGN